MTKTLVAFLFCIPILIPGFAKANLVTFDSSPYASVPYSEAGLTFSKGPGSADVFAGGFSFAGADGRLASGTNVGTPIHIIVSSAQSFNLLSLDIENLFQNWVIRSSAGAEFTPTSTGVVDFSSLNGWSNISGFELVHDPGTANGGIRIDDVLISPVPEPNTIVLFGASMVAFVFRRK